MIMIVGGALMGWQVGHLLTDDQCNPYLLLLGIILSLIGFLGVLSS